MEMIANINSAINGIVWAVCEFISFVVKKVKALMLHRVGDMA